jgi:hypothetical protein
MRVRRIAIAGLLVLATLLWTAGIAGVWAKRQALDTDNWVQTSDRLLENTRIRTGVALFLVDRLYESAAVEARLRDVLPPRLDPIAGPAASALREVARRNAPRLIGSAAALKAWRAANRVAHGTFKKVVEGKLANADVSLDLRSLMRQVAEQTGLPPSVADKLPPKAASLQILKSDQLDAAQTGVDALNAAAWVLGGLALVLFGAAIYLAADRRRSVLNVGACIAIAGIAVLALRHVGESVVTDALADAPNAHAAAGDVWSIGTSLLADAAQGSLLFGVFLVIGAWLAGPGERATALRRAAAPALRDRPAATRVAVGLALLLLVLWGPVPWTQRLVPVLLMAIAAFVWLEWLRRRAAEEFPDAQAGELRRRLRRAAGSMRRGRSEPDRIAALGALADLRERGVLDDAEFQREKAALLSSAPG